MSHAGDLAEQGRSFTLHRDTAEGVPARAVACVLRHAVDSDDADQLLAALGLTEVAKTMEAKTA